MTRTQTLAALTAFLLSAGTIHAADMTLPVFVSAGGARTSIVVGAAAGASDGYDKGQDVPPADVGDSLTAVIPHTEWSVTSPDGKTITRLYRDIRGSLPQQYLIQITSTSTPVTLTWDTSQLPASAIATLAMPDGGTINMKRQKSAALALTEANVVVALDAGDTIPPSSPQGLTFELKGTSFYLTWAANTEPDLAGYKLHWTKEGGFTRTVDLKNSTNYNLMNVANDVPYKIAVSAYDANGNESAPSSILTAVKATLAPVVIADGDVDGDGKVSIADGIKVLRMALHLQSANVNEVQHGDMDGDGNLTIRDALLLIRKVVRLK